MISLDELRNALGHSDMADAEAQDLCNDLNAWLTSVLDAYFESARTHPEA